MFMIYIEAIRKRHEEKMKALRTDALEKAKKITKMIRARYGAHRVILFGSLCRRGYIHSGSDIDLLVEGMSKDDLFLAGFDASMMAKPFEVDIIPAESAEKTLLQTARREGIEL